MPVIRSCSKYFERFLRMLGTLVNFWINDKKLMKKTIGANDNFIFNLHCLGLRKHVNDGARQMHVTFRNCLASFSNEAQKTY